MSRPAASRHQAAASSGSSQAENGTGRLPCLRRLNRSSSAAATVRPSTTRAAAGSWKMALTPRTLMLRPVTPAPGGQPKTVLPENRLIGAGPGEVGLARLIGPGPGEVGLARLIGAGPGEVGLARLIGAGPGEVG